MNSRLERVTPESAGISSRDIYKLIDDLENSGTEMHGIIILRHGKTVAEGWWRPYAPGIIHGSQSLTKTITGTAFGIAMKEGILDLQERLIDIFPEYIPDEPKPYLNELKMIHILTMSSGMETMPKVTDPEWQKKFFEMTIVHPPGTAFFYNSIACSMVGACIKKKTGLGLSEYLKPRLFDKIGIDAGNIRWLKHADGLENGSGGIMTTTGDNARLVQLYMNGGIWNGERILPEEWVKLSTSVLNDHFAEQTPEKKSDLAYGGMMWIDKSKNAFYADGAMGQLSIGFPEKDILISVSQTCADPESFKLMRKALFNFPEKVSDKVLSEDEKAYEELDKRLKALSLAAPRYAPYSPWISSINGRTCVIEQGDADFFPEDLAIFNLEYHDKVKSFGFEFLGGSLKLILGSESGIHEVYAGLDGRERTNIVPNRTLSEDVLLSCSWISEDTLRLDIRWIEICRTRAIEFTFTDEGVEVVSKVKKVGGFDVPARCVFAPWQKSKNR